MNITLYSGFKKAINSTKVPTGGRTVSVRLKDNCSILKPVFRLKTNDTNFNYVKWNNSYYYVEDIEHLINEEIAIHCVRDPMATFKGDIGGSKQYVIRSASNYNEYIADNKYPTFNIALTQTLMIDDLQDQINTLGTVVIGLINDTTNRSVTYYAFETSSDDFKDILTYMFTGAYLDSSTLAIAKEMQKELFNPIQYVVSAMWFPIPKSSISTFSDLNVKFGWWETLLSADAIPESGRVYSEIYSAFNIPRHPQANQFGKYMNGSPYTTYDLHCWGFGSIPIDSLPFVNDNKMRVGVQVDLFTGVAELYVTDNRGAVLAKQSCQFGIPFQLSQITQNLVQGAVTTMGTAISSITSFAAGNKLQATLGIANGIVNAIDCAMPQIRTVGSAGSKVQFATTPQLTCKYYEQVQHDTPNIGRPLMEVKTVSSLSGYMECSNVDLVTSATPEEKKVIINYMENGFFYE